MSYVVFENFVSKIGMSLPVVIGIVLAAAFGAMLLVAIFTIVSIKKSSEKNSRESSIPPSATKNDSKDDSIVDDSVSTTPYRLGIFINRILINNGYIKINSIVKSFFKAMEFLRNVLGHDYRYKLPWYMIVGTEGAGKSSLLSGFSYEEVLDDKEKNSALTWWFLKSGVVLDVSGSIFLPKNSFNADERSWNIIFDMLSRYRALRPLNGIILAIPADELYGKNKKPLEEIKKRAQYMSRKLYFAQNYIGMKLPIYVVVTKTDVVPGFQSFCSEIPTRNRTNMLGWSSTFSIDTLYTPQMFEDAFTNFGDELNNIRMEIFSENASVATRDGIFVFPSELLTIKESLACYIDAIFKTSSVEERFYFRGFYFTGDSKMVPVLALDGDSPETTETMAIMGTPDADINEAGSTTVSLLAEQFAPKRIFFFDDLLLKKIFLEDGLASAMRSRIHSSNRSIFLAKLSIAAFVVVGSYGLFQAKDKLKQNKNELYPSLFKVSALIKDARDLNMNNIEKDGNEILATCTNQLLSMMQQLNNSHFSSFFVPASWFSSINKDLTETLRISYQRVVVRTIYMNLLLKAKYFLNLKPTDVSTSIFEVLNPYNSKEYAHLKEYIFGLIELEKYTKKFDSVRLSGDPKDLNELIEYTFQGALPKEFLENYHQFRNILMNTPFPSIDLNPYKKVAYDVLINLFQKYLDTIFTSRSGNGIIAFFHKFIDDLIKQDITGSSGAQKLVKFSQDLSRVCAEIGKEGSTWLDKDVFVPDKEYEYFLDGVETLFGKDVAQQILDITAINFGYLKAQLKEFTKTLKEEAGNREKKPSSNGIFMIERCLRTLCAESFMQEPEQYEILTDIPEGKMIFWDDEVVEAAHEMGKNFKSFSSTTIKNFPKIMQEGIQLIAKENMCAVIEGAIAKAQSFVNVPVATTEELASEELLQKQALELSTVGPRFVNLLQILKENAFVFSELRVILNKIGCSLLNHVEKIFLAQRPYYPSNLKFDYWQGDVGAGFLAYSASDVEELTLYIELQRKIVLQLAIEFADVIVTFLNAEGIYDKNYCDAKLLANWTRIVKNVRAFEKKDPANSITLLERFVTKTLNEYNIENITSRISIEETQGKTGDYFLNIINEIKNGLLSRAEVILRNRNIARYERLRDYYVRHLEQTFPFSDYGNEKRVSKEAEIEDVKEFFKMYDQFGGNPEAILNQIYQLGDEGSLKCYEFLKKIHEFRMFFKDFFDNKYETIKIGIDVEFNVNKNKELNTTYLVDKIFKPNYNLSIEEISTVKNGEWSFGSPIEFVFRWVSSDPSLPKPIYDISDPDLMLDKNFVKIQCIGSWSVLRFFQKYKSKSSAPNVDNPNQSVLCFTIPLNNNKISRVYVGLTPFLPKLPGRADSATVKIPQIPGKMPEMSAYAISVKDKTELASRAAFLFLSEASKDNLLNESTKNPGAKGKDELPSASDFSDSPDSADSKNSSFKIAKNGLLNENSSSKTEPQGKDSAGN